MTSKAHVLLWASAVALAVVASGCGGAGGGSAAATPSGKHPLENNPAPDFSADSINGQGSVRLSQWKGKVVLVDFWATWCKPCEKSFPKFEELRVKYASSGLVVVAVSEDDEANGIKEFGANHGVKFPLVWDKDKSIANKWQPPMMPSTFLVDKKGVVRSVRLGYHDGEEKQIEAELKTLL